MYINKCINIYNNQHLKIYGKNSVSQKNSAKNSTAPNYNSIYNLKNSQIFFKGISNFENLSAKRLDKIEGCLLGGAIGDALGARIEPMPYNKIQSKYGEQGLHYIPKQNGIYKVTDDTQMTLFTTEALLNSFLLNHNLDEEPNYNIIYDSYQNWYRTQIDEPDSSQAYHGLMSDENMYSKRFPGGTCMRALKGGVMGTVENPVNNSYANGGIMRSAPIGLMYSKNPELAFKVGVKCAALTHGHPDAYLSAGCFASIIAFVLNGMPIEDAIESSLNILKTYEGHENTYKCIKKGVELAKQDEYPPNAIKKIGRGFNGAEALGIALFSVLKYPESYKHAIITAVNHDGDSDTTGAIAGNLAGLIRGENGIPSGWSTNVEHGEWIIKYSRAINSILQLSKPANKNGFPNIEQRWEDDKLI